MNYQNGQSCCSNDPLGGSSNYCGCGTPYPIVPGSNPSLQTWNGQAFVVADGSVQLPISLPYIQQTTRSNIQFVVGVTSTGTLSLVPVSSFN
jgi:hypothetical protein